MPGRDAITKITDTVETAVLKVNDLGRSTASIDVDIHSKKMKAHPTILRRKPKVIMKLIMTRR